ncbi:hypothetical protein [Niabella drilacis]|uniref:Uncharacterized protein n=1 Tax=Niabella drilacis (strain DSM 25811 / CCM 8410 / CCUG 62505 / LMG 26954 / E90) TaxID=1285928 RepID=A0A1G6WSV0_NIADE|nr:hypothetical protein [Niabella drilacis]SDD68884.1 hypothetical protein SAMN04487894_11216 [Niabella drilacis]
MDYKCTLDNTDSFLDQLKACKEQHQKVSVLSDLGGWERAEGMIREIVHRESADYLVLDNGSILDIAKIVAVNGVFKTDCSC